EGFIARGGNAAFFSGNTSFWQVRLEGPTVEGPAATIVGYKGQFKQDPVLGTERVPELTSMWSDHLIERPENHMTGVSFARGGYHRIGRRATAGAGGYTIHRPHHWIFDGTDIGYGDVLGAAAVTVGYECDGCDFTYRDGLPYPTGRDGTPDNFEILGTAPAAHFSRTTSVRPTPPDQPSEVEFIAARLFGARSDENVALIEHGHAVLGTYVAPSGGVVVTSGSTDWAHGLAGRDAQVEQITRNILDRLGRKL
ncbi:MAG TPA: N,N-dimethylformamidase beta subunit family domain-containing protein, partial [Acidimicrobiia bacterium]|nr:N,N-dimethylformamidase beta subunit family domain-containing protein [Acidimicrobiia bacterium]